MSDIVEIADVLIIGVVWAFIAAIGIPAVAVFVQSMRRRR